MAQINLDRVDAAPWLDDNKIDYQLKRWITILVDTLNTTIGEIETALNALSQFGLTAPSFTTIQITALAINAPNGTMWYDTSTNQLKGKINGVVVVIA